MLISRLLLLVDCPVRVTRPSLHLASTLSMASALRPATACRPGPFVLLLSILVLFRGSAPPFIGCVQQPAPPSDHHCPPAPTTPSPCPPAQSVPLAEPAQPVAAKAFSKEATPQPSGPAASFAPPQAAQERKRPKLIENYVTDHHDVDWEYQAVPRLEGQLPGTSLPPSSMREAVSASARLKNTGE